MRGRGAWRVVSLVGALLAACWSGPAPERHTGPVLLVTLSGLRSDVVGFLGGPRGWTPQLDRLASEADWSGRGIATSSWTGSSVASILTGLRPWQHGVLYPGGEARLGAQYLTVAESLQTAGFRTSGYWSTAWLSGRLGYEQGFELFRPLRQGGHALGHLSSLDGGPTFVWIHLERPDLPYARVDALLPRLAEILGARLPSRLPARVDLDDIARYFDPEIHVPDELLDELWSLYLLNVGWTDHFVGRLLEELRSSGQYDRTLVVVASAHGSEFGEYDQIASGGSLGRRLIEVPLIVKLPSGSSRRIAVGREERVSLLRLFATLAAATGTPAPPAVAPSLFESVGGGALSELYFGNGVNRFSWLDGNLRLLWTSRFAEPDPAFWNARLGQLEGAAGRRTLEAMEERFRRAPPLVGLVGAPSLELQSWTEDGERRVEDEALEAEMSEALRREWLSFQDRERPLQE